MSTLVLDIETVGQDWASVSDASRQSLTRWVHKSIDPEEVKVKRLQEVKNGLGFSPFTGSIVSLAMYDVERNLGATYFVSDSPDDSFKTEAFTYKQRTEKEILEDFWEGARAYDTFVTYNGRSFALPFLYHRSVINEVRPTVEIAPQRYLSKQSLPYHVDLLDELTFYGAMQKRPSLQLVCDAYGIVYQPEYGGEDMVELFRQKKFHHIAEHNSGDVLAIKSLYEKWQEYLAPGVFLNKSQM